MKFDYSIIELLHPHYVKDRGCVYDHVNWTVWISNYELLNGVNKTFDYNLELNKKNEVEGGVACAVWQYIKKQKRWDGIYGIDYDRNILDIYKDDDADRSR